MGRLSVAFLLAQPAALFAFTPMAVHRLPSRAWPIASTQARPLRMQGFSGKQSPLEELAKKVPDLGLKPKLDQLPEPVQPWVEAYYSQPILFTCDAIGLLLSAGFNPFAVLPFWLIYFLLAKPLGAYSDDATKGYRELLHNLGPAWAASTAAVLLLSLPFAEPFSPFTILGWLAKFAATGVCLAGPRAYQVYLASGQLPEISNLNFDIDAVLNNNAKAFEEKLGAPSRDKAPKV